MALPFDIKRFAELSGQGGGSLLENIGVSFGVPSCMLDLTGRALSFLTSKVLTATQGEVEAAKQAALDDIKKWKNKILYEWGFYADKDGKKFGMDWMNKLHWDSLAGNGEGLDSIGSWMAKAEAYTSLAGDFYANVVATVEEVERIKDCIADFKDVIDSGGKSGIYYNGHRLRPEDLDLINAIRHSSAIEKIKSFAGFVEKAASFIERVDGVLLARSLDPSLEPSDGDALEEIRGPVFRLVFGPPESTHGRFLLSKDGLYYDSQSEGLSLALGEVREKSKLLNNEDRWRFEHDPNLGGKGVFITSKDLKTYSNTIFDSNIVDNSPFMNDYYHQDNFLIVLTEQRDKRISDIEQQISEFSKSKAGEAIIDNTRQSLISEAALMDDKLNRRKKQIEVAVKAPSIFGDGPKFGRGNIPINDFSYLKDLNITVALSTQRRLVLDQDDVSGVVLPLEPEFVIAPENTEHTSFPELLVPEVGLGEVIYDTSNVSGTEGIAYSITDTVVDDGLIALYNFLDTEVVAPSSTEFVVNNSADTYSKNNCQLVAKDASCVFTKGIGVPYFEGITEHQPSTLVSTQPSALGSYAKLPDSRDFRDLMYNRSGFSIDFWTHVPSLLDPEKGWSDNGVSSQHRLVLACDNVGLVSGATSQSNILRLNPDFGESVVRGFVMGFTRDNRMVSDTDPSNDFTVNTSSDVGFYIAPTQSRDSSSAGFISSGSECTSTAGWHKWSMNAASAGPNGVKFKNAAKEYVNICLTVDPEKDEVKVYLDSNLMGTSTLTDVFATPSKHPPKLPSFRKYNSFEYSGASVGVSADSYLSGGPLLNTYFTPWIIGGGYTDGNYSGGNFMGGDYGGVRSGLRGHLGGMKFYEKPITESDVSQNFNAQKSFFKNVRTINTLKGKLFFLLGGENAKGQALLSDIPSASSSLSSQKFDNVYTWNLRSTPDRIWENLEAGYNSVGYDSAWGTQTTFGPELSLASSLSLAYPNENIYIAKMAPSGSFLEPSANGSYAGVTRPDWSTTSTQTSADRNLFNLILSSATTTVKGLSVSSEAQPFVKARGNEVFEVCGIFYVNGESDAAVLAAASDYGTNIKDFVNGLRSDLSSLDWVNTSAIPFIQTVIHDNTTDDPTGPATAAVRAAQLAVTGTVGMLTNYDLSSLTLQSNSRDLDASSCIVLGDALCNTYLDTL